MAFTLGPHAKSAGYRLASFDQIGSTNSEAMAQARAGERGPIWFVTAEQTAGRGRRHRPWIAPRGNLASSVLETIEVAPAVAATLGFAAGLALEAALRAVAGPASVKFSLKWPNDVLAGQAKLSGVLLEAEAIPGKGLAVVVGMGTNIIAAPEGTPTPATSLRAMGVETGAEQLFQRYRTAGPNAGASGIRGAALAKFAGAGWRSRRDSDSLSPSITAMPRCPASSTPSITRAA